MPTPLLPEVVPKTATKPVSFYEGTEKRTGVGQVWSLQNMDNEPNLLLCWDLKAIVTTAAIRVNITTTYISLHGH